MPPSLRSASDPAEWLRHARSNLSRCRSDRRLPEVLFEDLCFDAQQAAEKAVKAVLVLRGRRFPPRMPSPGPRDSSGGSPRPDAPTLHEAVVSVLMKGRNAVRLLY